LNLKCIQIQTLYYYKDTLNKSQTYFQTLTPNQPSPLTGRPSNSNWQAHRSSSPRGPASPKTLPPLLSRCQAGSARQPALLTLLPPSSVPSPHTRARCATRDGTAGASLARTPSRAGALAPASCAPPRKSPNYT
jgi:hypothetical protein